MQSGTSDHSKISWQNPNSFDKLLEIVSRVFSPQPQISLYSSLKKLSKFKTGVNVNNSSKIA
jgi:hypothetical protein